LRKSFFIIARMPLTFQEIRWVIDIKAKLNRPCDYLGRS
jgi:hypothetical protein